MAHALRHGAAEMGLAMTPDGFVLVSDLIAKLKAQCTEVDIRRVVANDGKQRYGLSTNAEAALLVRANQGHSLQTVDDDKLLTPVTSATEVPNCVHGTDLKSWGLIKDGEGLSRMSRRHIHFAVGLPGCDGVISGMRASCEVLVYLDVAKWLQAGFPLFRSANGVLLTPGNKHGFIPPKFFMKVVAHPYGNILYDPYVADEVIKTSKPLAFGPDIIPGSSQWNARNDIGLLDIETSKTSAKNARRREAKKKAKDDAAAAAATAVSAPPPAAPSAEKKIKGGVLTFFSSFRILLSLSDTTCTALAKKLRQVNELKSKAAAGTELSADQQAKVATEAGLREQIAELQKQI
jgi:2'-phosphotransferase